MGIDQANVSSDTIVRRRGALRVGSKAVAMAALAAASATAMVNASENDAKAKQRFDAPSARTFDMVNAGGHMVSPNDIQPVDPSAHAVSPNKSDQ
ncbi:MAG: hypothetical protein JWS12_647 [Candidatus Saccharibacteria bacterium]|nr:hypothetical protein [Candidatus Saccharibacteria bacterium]